MYKQGGGAGGLIEVPKDPWEAPKRADFIK
jgi:hypothetical protein